MMTRSDGSDRSLREELLDAFSTARLPSMPAVAAQILQLVNDPRSTAADFARAIEADPALAARLLKVANSAAHGQRSPVGSVKRAVTVIGLRRIRMAALGFELVSHLDRLGGSTFDLKAFWRVSMMRACLARAVAKRVAQPQAEEAFLTGLLQDCGIPVLVQVLGAEYADLYGAEGSSPCAFHEAEQRRFRYHHVDAITALAAEWSLPDAIIQALKRHHQPTRLDAQSSDVDRLAAVAYFAGSIRLASDPAAGSPGVDLMSYWQDALGLDAGDLDECLRQSETTYQEFAAMFGSSADEAVDITDLLVEANRHLRRAASETDRQACEAAEERDRVRRENTVIRRALGQYRERASRDPLTGLLNRGGFVAAAAEAIRSATDGAASVAVAFLDLDHFARINDHFGQSTGDIVLYAVAQVLQNVTTPESVVARYGGEEFVVLETGQSPAAARARAEALLEAVRSMNWSEEVVDCQVTCSCGTIHLANAEGATADGLVAAADQLMQQAKARGKDCGCFRSVERAASLDDDTASVVGVEHDGPRINVPESRDACDEAVDDATLQQVAEELNGAVVEHVGGSRKLDRRAVGVPAEVGFVYTASGGGEAVHASCRVRNVSVGGMGLVVARRLTEGSVVEVRMDIATGPIYVAGIIAFSRCIRAGIHDTGIQVLQHAREPILSGSRELAESNLALILRGADEQPGSDERLRRSA